ncbi:hypothetical protein BEWA_002130 [Theileria equi strain WA]|uniref:Uncharacterized protein n=1 Tax=Theileria equi strain WA TaxID=1537102 RepID=L0B0L6_THEEQ|nr:hypothetical protein BEWA_002130 [Theileria equi strain WA]AFZ80806.1 hypothetical protein BEWA_002130 [Theileria equi strain WA]|eukprot:XP_004830472.1 hypothetical protein BEWA_002130 [Theileria equi strain WA]
MGQKYSVVFDISKNKPFGNDISSYKDIKGNSVSLLRKDHPSSRAGTKFPGFKIYMHMLPEVGATYSYYLESVYYDNSLQEGLDKATVGMTKYVEVYFWEADYDNICPLFLELGDIYLHRKALNISSGIRSNKWTNVQPVSYESLRVLFENAVVISLQKTEGKKYTPHPSKDDFKVDKEPSETKFHTMTVNRDKDKPCQGYVAFTQKLDNGKPMNVLSTWNSYKKNMIRFKESIVQNEYKSAKIYYGSGDTQHNHPLILELELVKDEKGALEFYAINKDGRWEINSEIQTDNLDEKLDEQNCKYNNLFAVDLSKTAENLSKDNGSYSCGPDCKKHRITVSEYSTGNSDGYRNIQHVPDREYGDVLGRIKNGKSSLTLEGQEFPIERVSQVLVYYPLCSPKEPVLLRIYHGNAEGEWFKRDSISNNKWKRATEEDLKKGHTEKSAIKKVLDNLVKELNIPECEIKKDL